MFKVGDILKAKLDVAEECYEGCKKTGVYTKMMKLAETVRLKVIAITHGEYKLHHIQDDNIMQKPQGETEEYFEVATEEMTDDSEDKEGDDI